MSVWVSLTEYAAQRGVHRRTAQRWAREGRIPARQTRGGHWRVDVSQKVTVTVSEAAAELGVSQRTVRDWCRTGKLRARQFWPGCGWQIVASEIDRLNAEANEGGRRA